MNNKTYDIVKAIVQIGLPAAGTLYYTIASIWGLPKSEEVVGTLAAVATFLGVCLTIANRSYMKSDERFDGTIKIHESEEAKAYSMQLNKTPDELDSMKEVMFKVEESGEMI